MNHFRVALVLLFVIGCSGRGCRSGETPATNQKQATSVQRQHPSPTPDEVAENAVEVLPINTKMIAVFKADSLRALLNEIATAWPRSVLSETPEALFDRVKAIYGIDVSRLGPWCYFAITDGPVLICNGEALSEPQNSSRFVEVLGPLVYQIDRSDIAIALSAFNGKTIVGEPSSVRRIIAVMKKEWPSLARRSDPWRPDPILPATNTYREAAIYFPDPHFAPWCDERCDATVIYMEPSKGLAIVVRTPGLDASKAAERLEEQIRSTISTFDAIRETGRSTSGERVPMSLLKQADLASRSISTKIRGDVATLYIEGNVLALTVVLYENVAAILFGR